MAMSEYEHYSQEEVRWAYLVETKSFTPTRSNMSLSGAPVQYANLPYICSMCDLRLEDPKQLECRHVMCSHCVRTQKSLTSLNTYSIDGTEIHFSEVDVFCPVCASTTQETKLIPATEPASIPCFNPKCTNEASVECVECVKQGCSNCFDKLHELVGQHTRQPLGTIHDYKCYHHKKTLDFYCNNCLYCLCEDCLFEHDRTHSLMSSKEVTKGYVDDRYINLESNLENLGSRMQNYINTLDDHEEDALKHEEHIYNTRKDALEQEHEINIEKIRKQKQAQHHGLSQQCDNMEEIRRHVDRILTSDSTSQLRRWDILQGLEDKIRKIPFTRMIGRDGQFNLLATYMTQPTVSVFGGTRLRITWDTAPYVSKYRLRAIITPKCGQTIPLVYNMGKGMTTPIYADSSYGERGFIIYEGKENNFIFNGLRYDFEYQFTVECDDIFHRKSISYPSTLFKLSAPKLSMYVRPAVKRELCIQNNGEAKSFMIEYRTIDNPKIHFLTHSQSTTHIFDKYQLGKYYQFRVSGSNSHGELTTSSFTPPLLLTQLNICEDVLLYLRSFSQTVGITSSSDHPDSDPQWKSGKSQQSHSFQSEEFCTLDRGDEWITFDFGVPVAVSQVTGFKSEPSCLIEGSDDGENWTTIITEAEHRGGGFGFGGGFGVFGGGYGGDRTCTLRVETPAFYNRLRLFAPVQLKILSSFAILGTIRTYKADNPTGESILADRHFYDICIKH